MLGPIERLETSIKYKKHRPWIYTLAALALVEVGAIAFFVPLIAPTLIIGLDLATFLLIVAALVMLIVNEFFWVIWRKRF